MDAVLAIVQLLTAQGSHPKLPFSSCVTFDKWLGFSVLQLYVGYYCSLPVAVGGLTIKQHV